MTFKLTISHLSTAHPDCTMKTNDPTTEESKEHPPVPALPDTDITAEEETASDAKGKPVPNSKPRPAPVNPDDAYVYKDYAQTPLESLDTSTCHKKVPPQCLQAQKLPSKLAVMLTDPGELNIYFLLFPHYTSKYQSNHFAHLHICL